MATKKQLSERWKVSPGKEIQATLFRSLIERPARDRLREILAKLPFREEVASGLDLRGLEGLPFLVRLDLSEASLDHTSMAGHILNCNLQRASMVGLDAHHLQFVGDFRESRLVGANLRRAELASVDFRGADLSRAKMAQAHLLETQLQGATLRGADLRFATMARAYLSGADLRGANLTEASLGNVTWDAQTRLEGADLTGASIDPEFEAFARDAGVKLGEAEGAYELAALDATVRVLQERNHGGRLDAVIDRIRELRPQLAADPDLDWGSALDRDFPPQIVNEVEDALQEGLSALDEDS